MNQDTKCQLLIDGNIEHMQISTIQEVIEVNVPINLVNFILIPMGVVSFSTKFSQIQT